MARTDSTSSAREIAIERPGRINEFLWSCAGVNKAVLRQCPSDYSKYAGIGGMILFTAIMAAISGGYALFFVFNSYAVAGLFGFFWGLLIFNLDRFIVNTMYSDGKHTISWGEIRSGLPRIIMAIFLGLVISTPLEMKIFSDQIDSQLLQDNGRRIEQAKLAYKGLYDELDRYEVQKHNIQVEGDTIQRTIDQAEKDLKDEIEGVSLNGKPGKGPVYSGKARYIEQLKSSLARWEALKRPDIERLDKEIVRAKEEIRRHEEQIDKDATQNGFAVRYEAFENVTSWHDHPALALVALMITLLFVIIETAPTFLKMMMEDGPYDDLLRAQKYKTKVLADKSISDINDAVNTCVRISTMKNEKRLEAETIANEEIMAKIARAQAELLETAIAGWKETELEKIRQNPSAYVVSIVPPQQEMQVVADKEGNLSEFVQSDLGSMAAASTSIIEEAAEITPDMSAEDLIDNANNASGATNSEDITDSDSTTSNATDSTVDNREQV